jgi:type IV pilus assembly protein PilE
MALMLVLNLALMGAAFAAAILQSGSLAAHGALAAVEHVRAFHAADAVMALCERHVLAAYARGLEVPEGPLSVFGRGERWPGSSRLPECTIERLTGNRAQAGRYRITARGFASTDDAQSWAQMDLILKPGMLHRDWRPRPRGVPDPWRNEPDERDERAGRRSARGAFRVRPGKSGRVSSRTAAGLSLIEAMIALTITAIVAGYAVPVYRQHLARAHRLTAALAVRQAAQYIEGRRLFDHASGVERDARSPARRTSEGEWFRLPAHLARAPVEGPAVYRLRVDMGRPGRPSVTGMGAGVMFREDASERGSRPHGTTAYWIVAVPVESGPMASDACGSFILDASGRRSNTGLASPLQCWSGA